MKDRLKEIRGILGKSQRDMAKLIHISYQSWQGYEQGANKPGSEVLESLAKLGFNVNWILTGEGEIYEYGIKPDFWSYLPSTSKNSLEWMDDRLKDGVKDVIIIKYYDQLGGRPCGFMVVKNDNSIVSMSGGGTRTGYLGGGAMTYCDILKSLQSLNITVGIIDVKPGEGTTLGDLSYDKVLQLAKYPEFVIEEELHSTYPDKYPLPHKNVAAEPNGLLLAERQACGGGLNVTELIRDLMDIMESDDNGTKIAIAQNIKMFKESVKRKQIIDQASENDFKTLKSSGVKQGGGGN